jgi:hypothetical protein
MSRVLRRPMFRGGYVDSEGTGITSGLTDNYSQGGRVGFANGPSYFDVISPYSKQFGTSIIDPVKEYEKKISQIEKETQDTGYMYDPSGLTPITPGRNRTLREIELSTEKGKEDFIKDLQKQREAKIQNIVKTSENLPEETRKTLFDYYGITSKDLKTIQKPEEEITGTGAGTNAGRMEQTQESDTDVMNRYMEMFKANLAGDKDELKSQRYFELAKFGLNLLSQPGGPPGGKRDLLGAIGRAGVPAIEGLSRISAEEKAAERQAKILGFQAALRELENPALKKIQTLSKLTGVPVSEIAKRELAESGQSELNKLKRIESIKEVVESNNPQNQLSIAQIIVSMGKDIKDFKKQNNPEEKTGKEIKGQYYYFANPGPGGELVGRWDGNKFLVPGDKGFE